MPETWKPIPSIPEYEASSRGRVRLSDTGECVKQAMNQAGVPYVWLKTVGSTRLVKSLVFEAFNKGEPVNMKVPVVVLNGDENDLRPKNLTSKYIPNIEDVGTERTPPDVVIANIWKEVCPALENCLVQFRH